MSAKVTVEDVERVAELAHLELAPEETGPMLRDLNAILDYVAELNELDTSNVVPLAQVSEIVEASAVRRSSRRPGWCLRSIAPRVMAPGAGDRRGFFKVPKVIER